MLSEETLHHIYRSETEGVWPLAGRRLDRDRPVTATTNNTKDTVFVRQLVNLGAQNALTHNPTNDARPSANLHHQRQPPQQPEQPRRTTRSRAAASRQQR